MSSDSSAWMDLVLWDPQRKCRIDFMEDLVRRVEQEPHYMVGFPPGRYPWTFEELEGVNAANAAAATKKHQYDLDMVQASVLGHQYEKAIEKALREGWVHEKLPLHGVVNSDDGSNVGRQVLSKADAEAFLQRKVSNGLPARFFGSRHSKGRIEWDLLSSPKSRADASTDTVIRIVGNKDTSNRFDITEIKMIDRGHFHKKKKTVATAVTPPVVARTHTGTKRPSLDKDASLPRKKTAVGTAGRITASSLPAWGRSGGGGGGGATGRSDVGRREYAEAADIDDNAADDDGAHEPWGMGVTGAPVGRFTHQHPRHQQQHEHQQHVLQRLVQQQALHIRQQGRHIEQLLQQVQQLQQQQRNPGIVQRVRAWWLQEEG